MEQRKAGPADRMTVMRSWTSPWDPVGRGGWPVQCVCWQVCLVGGSRRTPLPRLQWQEQERQGNLERGIGAVNPLPAAALRACATSEGSDGVQSGKQPVVPRSPVLAAVRIQHLIRAVRVFSLYTLTLFCSFLHFLTHAISSLSQSQDCTTHENNIHSHSLSHTPERRILTPTQILKIAIVYLENIFYSRSSQSLSPASLGTLVVQQRQRRSQVRIEEATTCCRI